MSPSIGSKGAMGFKAPFDTLLDISVEYTIKSARTFDEIRASGNDAYRLYYEPYSISRTDFDTDFRNGEVIVGFTDSRDVWYYVPSSYITVYPTQKGVRYHEMVISVNIGYIPVSQDLTYVDGLVKELVTNTIGINPTMLDIETSSVILVDDAQHDTIQAARNALRTNNKTCATKLIQANSTIDSLTDRITLLENFILQNAKSMLYLPQCEDCLIVAFIEQESIDDNVVDPCLLYLSEHEDTLTDGRKIPFNPTRSIIDLEFPTDAESAAFSDEDVLELMSF